MNRQHTPGPWGFDPESGEVFYADNDVKPLIATVSCENAQTHAQYLADGALIAAATDLLALVERAEGIRHPNSGKWTKAEIERSWAEWDTQARAAIAKVHK